MRSISAASRRMEKEAARRHKEAEKIQTAMDVAADVESWENYIGNLLNVHTDLAEYIDWDGLSRKPQPKEPHPKSHHHDQAREELASFKPGMFDFLKGGSIKRRKVLEDAVDQAARQDAMENEKAITSYTEDLASWKADCDLAKRVVERESAAIQEVITEMQSLSQNDLIGSSVQFSIGDNYVHAKPQVHTDEIVPDYRRKQLASGKLSETKMPVGQFNELYQDYVASVALKVAGDLFQILPLEEVFVTCECNMLNSATGHKEPTPILSVQFVRETMRQLNLSGIDPSNAMANFNHNMKFSKTKGFSAIAPLTEDRC
ncbi:MAG: hypothetical protein OIF58_12505 [Cohaesibacter sp.]|nr:hypothetical protein [Cohaesibacter sp.]